MDAGELARTLATVFRSHGEELFLVGGAVRDRLLGQSDLDLDFATSALPDKTASLLATLGIGQPYRVGEKFGTIGIRVGRHLVEITTYRSEEQYAPGSRKPEVRFGRSLLEDLSRRDFTINAIAQDPLSNEIVDPLGGSHDLSAGLIRAVGNPAHRFREDPLRLLRAVRFASRLGFDIEGRTWQAIRASAPALETISRERIRDEYTRMLESRGPIYRPAGPIYRPRSPIHRPAATAALTLLRDGDLLAHSVPQLLELTRMPDHGPRHPLSLWDHTMRVVAGVPPLLALRWAALLHDIAKPATRTHEPSGRPRFFHHEEIGAQVARDVLTGLRYSNNLVDAVALLVETHMQLHSYTPGWSDGAVRRLMMRLGPLMEEAVLLARADAAGHSLRGVSENAPKFDHLQERLRRLEEDGVEILVSPLTGHDLMERYNRGPGPWIRRIKDALRDAVVEGRLAPGDKDAAWKMADALLQAEEERC
jgi:poly(A) polymerase